ncbi:mechanosensitive ion channel family protein [Prochlorococcus sp. MIT 1306]|uniref:mechanosensitive ion channel family protein n=1 Tax=Prochlorococcus sp. MIT 1306 TaxID=1799667 RepID=UPI0007B33C18|nr:mechanosensitive ion channel family protein [Prochlorococcus sp. MIT 1306]KZR66232.1 putative MscS family protein YkuT [Prochlorococcus sp. MIT 1306]
MQLLSKKKLALRLLVCLFCSLLISLLFSPAFAQISLGSTAAPISNPMNRPVWDLNRPWRCGRLYCSRVVFPVRILSQNNRLTLAAQATNNITPQQASQNIEQRAQSVQLTVKFVKNRLVRFWRETQLSGKASTYDLQRIYDPRFWWFLHQKPLHPLTPAVEIGTQNKATVIYLPDNPKYRLFKQTVITVTAPDAQHAGIEIPQLAQEWQQRIRVNFSDRLWGLEFSSSFPGLRVLLSAGLLLTGILGLFLLKTIRASLLSINRSLLHKQESLAESFKDDVMAAYSGNLMPLSNNDGHVNYIDSLEHSKDSYGVDNVNESTTQDPNPSINNLPRSATYTNALLNQTQNFLELVLLVSNFLRIAFLVLVLLSATAVYPSMRIYAFIALQQSIAIPLIWVGVFILRLLVVIMIDFNINNWIRRISSRDASSMRYTLRASTYSKVLKGGATVITIFLGLVFTLTTIGVDRSIFTSAGVIAVGVGFLSRNVLEDILNGFLILAGDRFAIGDVVTIGTFGGFVEDMNLFNTQLRGSDGQLTTLPNSQIRTVENLTKDWSRVNFDIEVSARENLRHVLDVVRLVANTMRDDKQWSDYFLDAPEILGIDQVQSSGCLIRVWIKTQPLAQWSVGREFRLQIKEAFDREGITLGAPIQNVLFFRPK